MAKILTEMEAFVVGGGSSTSLNEYDERDALGKMTYSYPSTVRLCTQKRAAYYNAFDPENATSESLNELSNTDNTSLILQTIKLVVGHSVTISGHLVTSVSGNPFLYVEQDYYESLKGMGGVRSDLYIILFTKYLQTGNTASFYTKGTGWYSYNPPVGTGYDIFQINKGNLDGTYVDTIRLTGITGNIHTYSGSATNGITGGPIRLQAYGVKNGQVSWDQNIEHDLIGYICDGVYSYNVTSHVNNIEWFDDDDPDHGWHY